MHLGPRSFKFASMPLECLMTSMEGAIFSYTCEKKFGLGDSNLDFVGEVLRFLVDGWNFSFSL